MRVLLVLLLIADAIFAARKTKYPTKAPLRPPPHIVVVMADDFGWANAGFTRGLLGEPKFGPEGDSVQQSKFEARYTPNLDEIASESLIFRRHYSYKICSPSRCMFQTGRFAPHVNDVNVNVMDWNASDPIGGFPAIPPGMTGIAQVLKKRKYQTMAVGKWDIGMTDLRQTPKLRGYDTFLGHFHHSIDYYTAGPGRV